MKRVPPKAKKKSKPKKAAVIRSLRGKYKHLDLMQELRKSRKKIDNGVVAERRVQTKHCS